MVIHAIMFDLLAKSPVVILKEVRGNRYLPILVGVFEASAIDMGLKKQEVPRPMTHDLLINIISEAEMTIDHVEINKIKDRTFFAEICLYSEGRNLHVDSRSSDAIAIAVRTNSPILVDEEILIDAGVEYPNPPGAEAEGGAEKAFTTPDESRKFKEFLSNLNPEDVLDIDDSGDEPEQFKDEDSDDFENPEEDYPGES